MKLTKEQEEVLFDLLLGLEDEIYEGLKELKDVKEIKTYISIIEKKHPFSVRRFSSLLDEIEEDYEEDNGDKEYEAWYYNEKERELENE